LPDKGLLGAHAICDPAMLDTPIMNDDFRVQHQRDAAAAGVPWRVEVKRGNSISTITHPFNALDAAG
jgi:homogentisate 1,2-dioxygenase